MGVIFKGRYLLKLKFAQAMTSKEWQHTTNNLLLLLFKLRVTSKSLIKIFNEKCLEKLF